MARMTKSKSSSGGPVSRREELRRTLVKPTVDVKSIYQRPGFVQGMLISVGFTVIASLLLIWSREQVKVDAGQVMTKTHLNRVDFTVEDETRTDEARDEARRRAPEVWELNLDRLETLRTPVLNLPVLVVENEGIESITPELRERFALNEAALSALSTYALRGTPTAEPTEQWQTLVDHLIDEVLPKYPLISNEAWEDGLLKPPLFTAPEDVPAPLWRNALPIVGEPGSPERAIELAQDLVPVVREAGFPQSVFEYVASALAYDASPTYERNQQETDRIADEHAAAVKTIHISYAQDDPIYRRGEILSFEQRDLLERESQEFKANGMVASVWGQRLGIVGLVIIITAMVGGYIGVFYPRIPRNPTRLAAIGLLLAGMLAVTVFAIAAVPKLTYLAAVGPSLLVAVIALLSYDQRIALFLSTMQCALVTLALEQTIGMFVLLFAGCGLLIAMLRELRHRSTLIRAATAAGILMAIGAAMVGVIETPLVDGAATQITIHALLAGAAGFGTGFLVLGVLPSIERWFDITTGMTLAELRDPKQPLLRQLQQRAPGTYNHSLQVANIAEAAAESIGADSLLVYVGALYHDIGKLNKPGYFVENQTEGDNKHDKLSPAMSLLVIVGHVKDGIELAKEYGLPRQIQHFIASHHGTTLVEFFYEAARTKAEADEKTSVQEVEYRYPGPKPQSKEAATLMLCDAVESATRTLADPNPARVESLVRELSRKRLMDGQFDQCDLTFRELGLIEDAIIKTVCAIYHSRISYPSTKATESEDDLVAAEVKPASA